MLRRVLGPMWDELVRGKRKLYNEKLFAKYYYSDELKEDEMGWAVARLMKKEEYIREFS
jgi:hypothetical protein